MAATDATPQVPLWSRLPVRFAVALCLGAAVILAAAGAWNVRLQREHLTRLLGTSASGSADIVRQATRDAMLRNDPDEVHRVIERIASQRNVERIRIFDKQGRVITSTDADEVGRLVDRKAEECVACHRTPVPPPELDMAERVRVFHAKDGHRVLGVTSIIRNEPDCSGGACHMHPADQMLLGVLDVHMPYAPVESQIAASERQMAWTLALTAAALLVLAGGLTWRMVLDPVKRLTRATQRVAGGDLDAAERVTAPDELGALTESWNAMVGELRAARDERDRWTDLLEESVRRKTAELTETHARMLDVERMASLGKLAAVVAHEVNNPLAGIATYARLLRRRLDREGAGHGEDARVLELMESEAARCGDIVRNLLLFSRTPGSRFVDTDLADIVRRCALLVRHQAELQDVQIDMRIGDDLAPLTADAAQVQQAILALCLNAIEAMPGGGILRIDAACDGADHVRVRVEDDGTGIDAADLPHVFEPFFTTKEQGNGVGLGLAVVHGIARRHGGSATVTSEPGRGAVFTVRLPRHPPVLANDSGSALEEVLS